MSRAFFEKLVWQKDRMLLDDLVFRLEHYKDENWELGEDCFSFYKIKPLVDQYAQLWSAKGQFRPQNILELGMWDGGSIVFWFECFHPKKHVGIDLSQRGDSKYFQRYITSRGLEGRIKTYWGTDQADSERLQEIVRNEFGVASQDHGHERAGVVLDLVIDDASHMYKPTKTSFETLFPLLCPGGLYVIEDWAWAHWEEFQAPHHPWATETELTKLIFELVEAIGSSKALIASLSIFQGFAAVERGEIGSAELGEFKIERYISSRPAEGARLIQERDVWQAEVARLTQELNTIYSSKTWRIAKKGLRVYQLAEAAGRRLVGALGMTPCAEAPPREGPTGPGELPNP